MTFITKSKICLALQKLNIVKIQFHKNFVCDYVKITSALRYIDFDFIKLCYFITYISHKENKKFLNSVVIGNKLVWGFMSDSGDGKLCIKD